MKVYVVTSGSYSDYHIEAVFARRAPAKVVAKDLVGNVEEYDVLDALPVRTTLYTVHLVRGPNWLSDRSIQVERYQSTVWPWQYMVSELGGKPYRVYDRDGWPSVVGTDKGIVEKVFKELRAVRDAEAAGLL